jgi:hypothetical protein
VSAPRAALAALACAACVTARPATPSKPIVEFPPPQSLAPLEAAPAAAPHVTTGDVPEEGWPVEPDPAAPKPDEAWQPQTPWDQAFAVAAAAEPAKPRAAKLRLTQVLSCVARELGRYLLDKKAPPPEGLQRFMQAACGAFVPDVGFASLSGAVPARVPDDRLLEQWGPRMKAGLADKVPAEATEAGFWFGRAHDRAAAIVAFAQPRARLEALSLAPDDAGNVTIAGELDVPATVVYGYANQGRFGVEHCAMDPSVARPRFRAVCRTAPDDATAWMQLYLTPPRRALSTPFVQILARRPAAGPLVYREESYGERRPVATPAEFQAGVLAELNAVRAQAHLPPVRLSTAESATATRLAGHYFQAALETHRGEDMDRIALGIMAGWQVTGLIRDGHFVSSLSPRTRDAGRWLTSTLSLPIGRATLLAPGIEEIALGPLLLTDPEGLAATVTGWELHHGNDHSADVARLYGRIDQARMRLGKPAARRLPSVERMLRQELERVNAGQIQPSEALQAALSGGVERVGRSMRGYVIEATSVDALEIPEEVVKQGTLELEIGVTHHKPQGAAWAQLVIVVVFVDYRAGVMREARDDGACRAGAARRLGHGLSHPIACPGLAATRKEGPNASGVRGQEARAGLALRGGGGAGLDARPHRRSRE